MKECLHTLSASSLVTWLVCCGELKVAAPCRMYFCHVLSPDACYAATLGAARKAGLHLSCGHDDAALATIDCILDNIGAQAAQINHLSHLSQRWVQGAL